jgi:antirestriction protein
MNTQNTAPRIYVASLADYNAGRLHGRWIDANRGEEHIRSEIDAMLQESKELVAEDWAIHDYEGFSALRISEFAMPADIAHAAALIEEHGPLFAHLAEHFGGAPSGLDEAEEYIENAYDGVFSSAGDYAHHFIGDLYADVLKQLPEFIRFAIDYDAIGRDLELGGDIFTIEIDGDVHVFAGHL